MKINTNYQHSQLLELTKDQPPGTLGQVIKSIMPYIIGAALMQGLAEQIRNSPADTVLKATSYAAYGGKLAFLAGGVYNFVKIVDPKLKVSKMFGYKHVEKITLPKQDLKRILEEIERLKAVETANKKDAEHLDFTLVSN